MTVLFWTGSVLVIYAFVAILGTFFLWGDEMPEWVASRVLPSGVLAAWGGIGLLILFLLLYGAGTLDITVQLA